MPAVRLDLQYDGTDFRGYARQPDVRTVQEELEVALTRLVGPVDTIVAGRTDAGVHARHQVVSFELDEPFDALEMKRRLNRMLPDDVVVDRVSSAPPGFDARFSAVSRAYRYHLLSRETGDPFRRRYAWHVEEQLDAFAMNQAARHLIGQHDFASFCRKAEGRTTVRTVLSAKWSEPEDGELQFDIEGHAFCHQMVRSIVALCVDVGRGKLESSDVPRIIRAENRNAARGAAPAHGLTLWRITY